VIAFLCFIPGDVPLKPELDIPYLDKFVHICFYFFLSLTIQYEVKNKMELKNHLYIFIYVMVLGGFIEIVQENFITERSGDIFDLIADLSGAIIAFFVYKIVTYQDMIKQDS
jgi:VanZ family protein